MPPLIVIEAEKPEIISETNKIQEINNEALRVENLYKVFDSHAGKVIALRNINFSIKRGEFVAIIGPSGSGKSTLLNMIGALDKPTYGKILIGGVDILSLNYSDQAILINMKI